MRGRKPSGVDPIWHSGHRAERSYEGLILTPGVAERSNLAVEAVGQG